jgi:hypothetical protein
MMTRAIVIRIVMFSPKPYDPIHPSKGDELSHAFLHRANENSQEEPQRHRARQPGVAIVIPAGGLIGRREGDPA